MLGNLKAVIKISTRNVLNSSPNFAMARGIPVNLSYNYSIFTYQSKYYACLQCKQRLCPCHVLRPVWELWMGHKQIVPYSRFSQKVDFEKYKDQKLLGVSWRDGAASDENTSSPGSSQKMPTVSPTRCQNSSFESAEEIISPTSSSPFVPWGVFVDINIT